MNDARFLDICVGARCGARSNPWVLDGRDARRPLGVEGKPFGGHMSVLKTKPTEVSVESHIAAMANEEQRNDARRLVVLMRKVTRHKPRMWGPSIVGFGSYHYKYASGHEGDSALAGFAARGRELVVYIAPAFEGRDALLARLGKHKTGKVCVYIRRLANIDLQVLEKLIARSVADTKSRYPQPKRMTPIDRPNS